MGKGVIVAETWRAHGRLVGFSGFRGTAQSFASQADGGDWTLTLLSPRTGPERRGSGCRPRGESQGWTGRDMGLCLGTSGWRRGAQDMLGKEETVSCRGTGRLQ